MPANTVVFFCPWFLYHIDNMKPVEEAIVSSFFGISKNCKIPVVSGMDVMLMATIQVTKHLWVSASSTLTNLMEFQFGYHVDKVKLTDEIESFALHGDLCITSSGRNDIEDGPLQGMMKPACGGTTWLPAPISSINHTK